MYARQIALLRIFWFGSLLACATQQKHNVTDNFTPSVTICNNMQSYLQSIEKSFIAIKGKENIAQYQSSVGAIAPTCRGYCPLITMLETEIVSCRADIENTLTVQE